MPVVSGRDIASQIKSHGVDTVTESLKGHLEAKRINPADFSIRDFAENLIPNGREFVRSLEPRKSGGMSLMEAANAVTTADFANITGQFLFSTVLKGYEYPAFVFSAAIPTIPSQYLNGERIPGVGDLGDAALTIKEGRRYPLVGMAEDWIDTPPTAKKGFILPITREAIFADRTGLVLRNASLGGRSLGLSKEKELIDLVIGAVNNHKWRDTAYNTYQTTTPWDNTTASNALVDWTDIDAAEGTLAAITDPNSGEPVMVMAKHLACPRNLMYTALRIRNATEIIVTTPGFATSANPNQATVANPMLGKFEVLSNALIDARIAAGSITATNWWFGDFAEAFGYMQNWGIEALQAPPNSEAEFSQDIAMRFKFNLRGIGVVLNPRYVTQCTVA